MTRKLLLFGTVLGLWLPGSDLASQESRPALKPGDRIRVYRVAEPDHHVTGRFVACNAAYLALVSDGAQAPINIPFVEITKLERSTGKHGHSLLGLGIGTAAGLGVGLAGAASSENSLIHFEASEVVFVTAGFGAAGALIGSLIHSESWVEVPLARFDLPPTAPTDSTTPTIAPIAAGQ
jgi:hypothetical protein